MTKPTELLTPTKRNCVSNSMMHVVKGNYLNDNYRSLSILMILVNKIMGKKDDKNDSNGGGGVKNNGDEFNKKKRQVEIVFGLILELKKAKKIKDYNRVEEIKKMIGDFLGKYFDEDKKNDMMEIIINNLDSIVNFLKKSRLSAENVMNVANYFTISKTLHSGEEEKRFDDFMEICGIVGREASKVIANRRDLKQIEGDLKHNMQLTKDNPKEFIESSYILLGAIAMSIFPPALIVGMILYYCNVNKLYGVDKAAKKIENVKEKMLNKLRDNKTKKQQDQFNKTKEDFNNYQKSSRKNEEKILNTSSKAGINIWGKNYLQPKEIEMLNQYRKILGNEMAIMNSLAQQGQLQNLTGSVSHS